MEPTIHSFFNGNCLEAMTHHTEVQGGEIKGVFRNADAPDPQIRMSGDDDMIMNMAMSKDNAMAMASDNSEEHYEKSRGFRVWIAPASLAEFEGVDAALAEDAEAVEVVPDETFWDKRFAMFTEKSGTPWMLNREGGKTQGEPT